MPLFSLSLESPSAHMFVLRPDWEADFPATAHKPQVSLIHPVYGKRGLFFSCSKCAFYSALFHSTANNIHPEAANVPSTGLAQELQ